MKLTKHPVFLHYFSKFMGILLFVLKYMHISLLLKMINGFSWPAKIMASPFNFIAAPQCSHSAVTPQTLHSDWGVTAEWLHCGAAMQSLCSDTSITVQCGNTMLVWNKVHSYEHCILALHCIADIVITFCCAVLRHHSAHTLQLLCSECSAATQCYYEQTFKVVLALKEWQLYAFSQ